MADALIFYAEDGAKACIESGIDPEKVFVAWNSVDTDEIGRHAVDWEATVRHRILYIGRIVASKKLDRLITAFAKAVVDLPDGDRLTIVGDGPEKWFLEQRAVSLGIQDRVEFLPASYDESQLAQVFNESWISVSTGNMGLNGIHSLSYGVPMLVARGEKHAPEIAAVKDGETGIFFDPNSSGDLTRQLVALRGSPGVLSRMSTRAVEVVASRFSTAAMVKVLQGAFEHAVSSRGVG